MDTVGCVKSQNEIAREFNLQLKERVSELRAKLIGAKLTYVDIYLAKFTLIAEAGKHGESPNELYQANNFTAFN